MRRAAFLVVLLAPLAAAGTADDPEVLDPPGDASPAAANPWGDLAAAWLQEADGKVTATMQLSSRVWVPPMTAYLLLFDAADASWYAAVVFADSGPS